MCDKRVSLLLRVRIAMSYFIKGILIGLVFGVPAGVIGAATIKRTLSHGMIAGLVSGLGCSAADLAYCCVSIYGLTFISDFMLKYQDVISCIGGAVIIIMGIGIIRSRQEQLTEAADAARLITYFASSFIIAITNPATILSFLLAFSIFNIENIVCAANGIRLASGIFAGTCVWWFVIAGTVQIFKRKITDICFRRINQALGIIILTLGAAVIVRVII